MSTIKTKPKQLIDKAHVYFRWTLIQAKGVLSIIYALHIIMHHAYLQVSHRLHCIPTFSVEAYFRHNTTQADGNLQINRRIKAQTDQVL